MQLSTGVGGKADHIAGVGWNLRLVKDDVQHRPVPLVQGGGELAPVLHHQRSVIRIAAEHIEDVDHRFARAVFVQLAVAAHDLHQVFQRLIEPAVGDQRMGQVVARVQVIRVGGGLLGQLFGRRQVLR